MTKVCNVCREHLPINIFVHGKCRPCINKLAREKYAIKMSDPEYRAAHNAREREYKKRKPRSKAQRRKEWLKGKYNITPADYEALLLSQNGVCAICQQECKTTKFLAIDHDHKCCPGDKSCGKCIRGLLCANCNGAIGMFQEDIAIFNRALEYLS